MREVKKSKLVDEVLVVDACSRDRTAEVALRAGARVVKQDKHLPSGKGTTMQVGIENARGDVLVFFDADINNFKTEFVDRMVSPILKGEADFVKGSFTRTAGRVTEMVAKPLITVFFPEVKMKQPLSGQIAGRRELFERIRLERDWGVDVGILLDLPTGVRIREVDLGYISHRMKREGELSDMSQEVAGTIMTRSVGQGRLFFGGMGNLFGRLKSWLSITPPETKKSRVVIFDMDGVLLKGRVIDALAREYGFAKELRKARERCAGGEISERELSEFLARFLKGLRVDDIEKTVSKLSLNKGVKETVKKLKQRGFKIAILSDSYQIACNVTGKRIKADYSIGNILEVKNGRLTGVIIKNQPNCSECDFSLCKKVGVERIARKFGVSPRECIIVGDGENDAHAMDVAGLGVAFNAASKVKEKARILIDKDMRDLLEYLS
ncbi:phosphoserine phosphatase SerB [Candidatus Micrarchaeota archaeon]|nr:phosphoserine phosphatase SerB [Candidatus Micrarchaeota archaeon]